MKNTIVVLLLAAKLFLGSSKANGAYLPSVGQTKAIAQNGTLSLAGSLFMDTFSVSSATPTIQLGNYLRSNGYTKAKSYGVVGFRAGATVSNSPQVAITAFTDTSITVLISQQNTSTVTILGVNVLSGLPMVLVPDPSNVKVVLSSYMY